MRFLIFCSLPRNSGSYVMGKYIARSLAKQHKVEYVNTFNRMPFNLYYLASIPVYLFKSLFKKSDVTIVLKPFPAACLAAFIQKLYGAKTILDIDDVDYGYTGYLSGITKHIQSLFSKKFDLIFVHNAELMKRVQQDFGIKKEKLFLRDQGVDLDVFKPMRIARQGRKKRLIFTGHLNASSYLGEILNAFKLASMNKKNIELIVIGDGYKKTAYEKTARKLGIDVKFLGYISNQDVIARHIASSDAGVVYYPETLGNKYRCSMKLREYLAMGKPAACNDFGDLKRFKKYTYMSRTGDIKAFSGQIIKALFRPDKRELMGMSYVRSNLSWNAIVENMLEKIQNAQ